MKLGYLSAATAMLIGIGACGDAAVATAGEQTEVAEAPAPQPPGLPDVDLAVTPATDVTTEPATVTTASPPAGPLAPAPTLARSSTSNKPKATPPSTDATASVLSPTAVTNRTPEVVPTKAAAEEEPAAESGVKAPSHETFDELLQKYVSSTGAVNYAGLKAERAKLDAYLTTLGQSTPTQAWSRDERLAYWINAYNAATIRLILDNYPLKSIQDLDGGKTWDVKRVKLGAETYSLNQIENDIIRPRFKEPRIHFAVNCAAKGCPPLRNEAFTAGKLERQLADQTKKFVNDPRYTKVDDNAVTVSKIFDWYGSDFADVKAFIGKYRNVPAGAALKYSDYDWSLNKA